MQVKIPLEINNHLGERIDFSVHTARDAVADAPWVLIGHGITANKDRPLLVAIAEALARAGLHALRFSFAGNGNSTGRFEESSVIKQVEELGAIISACSLSRVAYVGHSLGGAVGVLRAARDPRITHLVTVAGIGCTAGFVEREFAGLRPGVDGMWGDAGVPLSAEFVGAMRQVSVMEAAHTIDAPWLLVHGLTDDLVPAVESRDMAQAARGPTRLELLEGADHVFSGEAKAQAARLITEWLREQTTSSDSL